MKSSTHFKGTVFKCAVNFVLLCPLTVIYTSKFCVTNDHATFMAHKQQNNNGKIYQRGKIKINPQKCVTRKKPGNYSQVFVASPSLLGVEGEAIEGRQKQNKRV